jgi:L-asparaginase II
VEPIVVQARRAGVVEARHRVHAVAVHDGAVVAQAGDAELVCFMRSSSKPFQALPLALARDDLDERDLAIASASHRAEPAQIDAVRALLAKAPADPDELECGLQEGRPPERLYHNCSGKHAGMLALCRARGWPGEGYRLPDHPVQQGCLAVHAEAAQVHTEDIATGTDGCGVVTFALPLERMALMFSRLEGLDGAARVVAAMRTHPELIGGTGSADTELMQALPGWIAKGGAEGLLCAASPTGIGVALRVEDGSFRAQRPALAAFLHLLGIELSTFSVIPIDNSRYEQVGELVVEADAK